MYRLLRRESALTAGEVAVVVPSTLNDRCFDATRKIYTTNAYEASTLYTPHKEEVVSNTKREFIALYTNQTTEVA